MYRFSVIIVPWMQCYAFFFGHDMIQLSISYWLYCYKYRLTLVDEETVIAVIVS